MCGLKVANHSKWLLLFPGAIVLVLLSGCKGRASIYHHEISLAYPCQTSDMTMRVWFSENSFSGESILDYYGFGSDIDPCLRSPSESCYSFWYTFDTGSTYVRGETVGEALDCKTFSVSAAAFPVSQWHDLPYDYDHWFYYGKSIVQHIVTCSGLTLIPGSVVHYSTPDIDHYDIDSRTIDYFYPGRRIPTRIDLDVQISAGSPVGTDVHLSGSVVSAKEDICPQFEHPPSGMWHLSLEGDDRRYVGWLSDSGEIWFYKNFTGLDGVQGFQLFYEGDNYYQPAYTTGTIRPSFCNEPYSMIIFDPLPSAIPGIPVTVGITVGGRGYDDKCVASDLVEGSLTITTEKDSQEGPTCIIDFQDGAGQCDLIFDTAGTYTLTATYDGGGLFEDATVSGEITLEKLASETQITYVSGQLRVGSIVSMSVEVNGLGPVPTGEVQINAGGASCIAQLADGEGSCALTPVLAGGTDITAEYQGDEVYLMSSTTYGETVDPAQQTTVTNITGSTFTGTCGTGPWSNLVTVQVVGAGGTPTGTVAIAGADTNCTIALSGGVGSCTVYFNDSTNTTLIARYSGDSNFKQSQGSREVWICW